LSLDIGFVCGGVVGVASNLVKTRAVQLVCL